jgi:hypothetical protein
MGEQVRVGPLIYTVLEAEWRTQFGSETNPKVPQHRFLVVRFTVTNSGGGPSGIPTTAVEDANGNVHMEVGQAEGLEDWLGPLRRVNQGDTLDGRVVFDVPRAPYRLRVFEDTEVGQEQFALVEIPMQLDAPEPPVPAK